MKNIKKYLSGDLDKELQNLIAKEMGWRLIEGSLVCYSNDGGMTYSLDFPPYHISKDSCSELLKNLSPYELNKMADLIYSWRNTSMGIKSSLLTVSAREICVGYLALKNILS